MYVIVGKLPELGNARCTDAFFWLVVSRDDERSGETGHVRRLAAHELQMGAAAADGRGRLLPPAQHARERPRRLFPLQRLPHLLGALRRALVPYCFPVQVSDRTSGRVFTVDV